MNPRFNHIVGIDQTGALDRKKRFQPLYCVSLKLGSNGSVLSYTSEYLERLDLQRWRSNETRSLILVDAVLGLPENLWLKNEGIRDLLGLTRHEPKFGMRAGEIFFEKLYQKRAGKALSPIPASDEFRECERTTGGQSLFRSRPYQRNVQTGTLRVWHELANQSLDEVSIWPFDPVLANSPIVLAEGYPRLFKDLVLPDDPKFADPNFRDAARLAWGARACMLAQKDFLLGASCREGGIFSVPQKT